MLNLGFSEIVVIVLLTILVVKPDDLPNMLRYLGRQYGKIMRYSDELKRAFLLESEREDAEKRAVELKKKREEARRRADELRARALAGKTDDPLPRPLDAPSPAPPAPDPATAAPPPGPAPDPAPATAVPPSGPDPASAPPQDPP